MFKHDRLPAFNLIRQDGKIRTYLTPDGKSYPSVTTVLGFEPKPEIEAWRARIGETEAKLIMNRAAARGTLIHSYAEDYLNNKKLNVSMFDIDMWNSFRKVLDKIDNVRLIEGKLYSHRLKLAGTCDCVADYCNVLSLIDFKTSLRLKCEADILNYFLQCTCYSMMIYERYGIIIKQIVVLIAVDNEQPQIFIKDVKDYIIPTLQIIKKYYDHSNILSIIQPVN